MKAKRSVCIALVGCVLLAWGCATSGPLPPARPEPGHCLDRTRLGYPESLGEGQVRLVRMFAREVAPEGVDPGPLPGPRPDILNRSEVARALEREYPRALRDRRVSGTAQAAFLFDEEGRLESIGLVEGTGHPELDEAAMRVADLIRFSETRLGDPPACWVSVFPISFVTR